jgi:hypothetical protein
MGRRYAGAADITPSPGRLLTSLRDVGYDFVTAIADLVDNSLSAGARRVSVELCFEDGPPRVVVADDGAGMTRDRLAEALRLGSVRDYESNDLGKFGLGLKTASLSQCRRLTVITRHSRNYCRIASATLDIDTVATSNKWRLSQDTSGGADTESARWLFGGTGTVVIWEKLDRLVEFNRELSGWDRRRLRNMAEAASSHLAMVFHRFIEGVQGRPRLRLVVNGKKVPAWNPFASAEKHTQVFPEQDFELITPKGAAAVVRVRAHVLPSRDQFSSQAAFEALSGPKKWNRQQGFYIYRNDRLVQSGGWSGMRAADEHTKLARVAVDFSSSLDELFNVNIAKMRVSIPSQLRTLLERAVLDIVKAAQSAYRGDLRVIGAESSGRPTPEHGRPAAVPAYGEFMIALRAAALATGDGKALSRIFGRLRREAPELAGLAGLLRNVRRASSEKGRASPDVG